MDVIQVPLVPLVDSTNRKIGNFSDEISFLEQLKRPDTTSNTSCEDEEEEDICHIIGETPLHIAIMYDDYDTIEYLIECRGIDINQRSIGVKFPGSFKTKDTSKAIESSNYGPLAYYGEYPLCFAACFASKDIYDYLIEKGADPNLKDSNGNTLLHVLVMNDKMEMFLYACNHPKLKAKVNTKNSQGITPFNLAAKLGRMDLFTKIIELNVKPFWYYNNVACLAYPLEGIDTIETNTGKIDNEASLPYIIHGDTEEHLDMLNITLIENLLNDKWDTYVKKKFYQRLTISLLHLIFLSIAVYTRAGDSPTVAKYPTTDGNTIARYIFECLVVVFSLYSIFTQIQEIYKQGFKEYIKSLFSEPGLVMYQLFNFFILMCIPFRFATLADANITARHVEETFLCLGIPLGWLHLLFYLKVFKITGPFVVMIYKMVIGDIAEFSTIYSGFLFGFTLGFYYFYKNAGTNVSKTFGTFPEALHVTFQMTLGAFRYGEFNYVANRDFLKFVFLAFMLFMPVILMNLLIAMMGNTYNVVSAISEKEWKRQWAHCILLLERTFSDNDLKKFQSKYAYRLPAKEAGGSEVTILIVRKTIDVTKAKLKKESYLGWSRMYNKVQKNRRENKCNSTRLLEIWKDRNKIVQVVKKVKKEKKPFDWAMYGGNPHAKKAPITEPRKGPEKYESPESKKMDLSDMKQPLILKEKTEIAPPRNITPEPEVEKVVETKPIEKQPDTVKKDDDDIDDVAL